MNLGFNLTWAFFLSGTEIVAVSGTWMPLLSTCNSCGITTETTSGGMTLFAPYNRGQCVSTQVVGLPVFELKERGVTKFALFVYFLCRPKNTCCIS